MRYSTVLFDLDGTLIDSIELILSSYRHTMQIHRGDPMADDLWIAGLGTPLRVQFTHFTDDPAEIEAMIATYREHNIANHDRMVTAYPGALDTLKALKAAGTKLGIVTSKNDHGLARGMDLCGFNGLFDSLVTCDTLPESKPDPAPVRRALQDLGADAKTTLFVGDSPHDMAAGQSAGTDTAACLWGPFTKAQLEPERPTWWLESFADLARVSGIATS
ncbi:MAG TPA: HAD-IA family hydrolase [Gemmatimonadales bacterium]